MSNVLGTLTIDLIANTSSFTTEMGKMESLSAKSASSIKRSLETIGVAGLAMATAVVGGLAGIVTKSVEVVESLSRLSQAAGSTVEGFSLLSFAAKRSNTDSETLAGGLEKVSKAAFSAQNGNKELSNVFARLGISTVDANGHLRDSSDIFQQVAVKFAGMADGAGKTALSMLLFGRGGAALIPMLDDLGEHQKEITDQATRFGLVLSSDVTGKSRAFHDTLVQLKAGAEGFGIQLTAALLPALTNLATKLSDIATKANIPQLAASFGANVSKAIDTFGAALDFATTHAQGLKVALEALVALKLSSIAIPLLAQLSAGGIENIAAALNKLTLGFFNLGKVLPVLSSVTTAIKFQAEFIALLASEEGVAAAASYALGAGLAAIGGPVTIAIAAVVALGVALHKFRDSTFLLMGTTYELRDTWNAAFIFMGKGVTNLVDVFERMGSGIKAYWLELVDWFGRLSFVAPIERMFNAAINTMVGLFGKLKGLLGALVPQWVTDAIDALKHSSLAGAFTDSLDQAKKEREAADRKPAPKTETSDDHKPQGDTSGLTPKPTHDTTRDKDIVADTITKLREEQDAATSLFGAYNKGADEIEKVNAQNKASAIITDLNIKLADKLAAFTTMEGTAEEIAAAKKKLTAEELLGHMTDEHEATIRATITTTAQTAAANAFGTTLVDQIRTTGLATTQAMALSDAMLNGSEAERQAAQANMILALESGKSAEQLAILAANLDKIKAASSALAGANLTSSFTEQTKSIREQITTAKDLITANFAGADAVEKADLATKLRTIDTELGASSDVRAVAAAQSLKAALSDLASAEHAGKVASEAGASANKYQDQLSNLKKITDALTEQINSGKNVTANAVALRDATIETLKAQIALNDQQGLSHNSQRNQLTVMQGQQTLQGWNQIGSSDIGADIEKSLESLPQELGNTISNAVFNHKKGDSTGKQLGELFRNLGKNLFGDVAGKLIEKLAAEIAVHVLGIQIQATATTALAANTAAILANTAAQAVSGAGSAVGGAAGGVGSAVGGIAGSAGGAAASGLIGPLIAAAGGIIGGIISGVMSMIGDNKIVAAVNGTTSAVNALGGRLGGTYATSTSSTGLTTNSTAPTTAPSPTNGIPFIGGFLQSLFGFGGGSNATPVPVSIVSVSPVSPLSGFFKMLGFASGGRPQPGVPYLTGEKGVELRVDDGPGSIIPNHDVAGYLSNRSSQGGSNTDGHHTFHIYEANSPRETARQVASYLKNANPKFSQFSH